MKALSINVSAEKSLLLNNPGIWMIDDFHEDGTLKDNIEEEILNTCLDALETGNVSFRDVVQMLEDVKLHLQTLAIQISIQAEEEGEMTEDDDLY